MLCEQQQNYSPFSSLSQASTHSTCFYSEQPELQSASKYTSENSLDDLIIVRKLNKANFPVFLSYSPSYKQYFAMKVFPFQKDGKVKPNFLNEIQFAQLNHPNVIPILEYQAQKTIKIGDCDKNISFIMMELAPHGDFFDMIMTKQICFNETLSRTYFHQLIEGLEYLHSQGVAHLDIKLENLLVCNNFQMKIADFDNARINGHSYTTPKGTAFYRAPEVINGSLEDGYAADIYSAAIILFLFKSAGVLPHSEDKLFKGMNLFDMMINDNDMFWAKHCEIQKRPAGFFEEDMKELFNGMSKLNPKERMSIKEIKKSKWYNGPVYTPEEVVILMEELYSNM